MTSTPEPEAAGQILKTDKLGRVQVPPERRDAILDEFERSGMTGTAFAERYGIKYQTFASWRRKRKKRAQDRDSSAKQSAEFLLIETAGSEPSASAPSDALEIELAGGALLRIRSQGQAALAAELLRTLGS